MLRRFLSTVIAVCLVSGCASAATKRKKPGTAKSSASAGRSTKAKARGKTTSSASRARRSGPARQMTPTPERYMEIQRALTEKGYYNGPVNGSWSPECVEALKRFQEDQNLAPDGKLGALSIIALGLGPKRQLATDLSSSIPATTEDR